MTNEETKEAIRNEDIKSANEWEERQKQIYEEYKERKIIIEDRTQEQIFKDYFEELLEADERLKSLNSIFINTGLYNDISTYFGTLPYGILNLTEKELLELENKILYLNELQKIEQEYNVKIQFYEINKIRILGNLDTKAEELKLKNLEKVSEINSNAETIKYIHLFKVIKKENLFQELPEIKISYLEQIKNETTFLKIKTKNKTKEELQQATEAIKNRTCFQYIFDEIEKIKKNKESDKKILVKTRGRKKMKKEHDSTEEILNNLLECWEF